MGRGRAKAKQQKVARELKYHTPQTDLRRLQQELGAGGSAGDSFATPVVDEDDDEYDEYSDYDDEDDEDDDGWVTARR